MNSTGPTVKYPQKRKAGWFYPSDVTNKKKHKPYVALKTTPHRFYDIYFTCKLLEQKLLLFYLDSTLCQKKNQNHDKKDIVPFICLFKTREFPFLIGLKSIC